jgi:pimeloyl-ACP methyl ester carboxylesterase
MEHPIVEARIPHTHAIQGEGEVIPVNILLPPSASPARPCPLVIIMTGLDGYRTELAVWQRGWLDKGVGTLVVEIPGTGDSPAAPSDPSSPDREWSSVLDWTDAQASIDSSKIIVWGFSTGGYYALRIAHTHCRRLLGSVSLGGGCHHMFARDWLAQVNKLEYPFDLADTLASKFGYADLESFIKEAHKFSLLEDGTLEKPCCKMLLVNGTDDEIFPIDDLFIALESGAPKLARLFKGKKHMGEPGSFMVILRWIHGLLGLDGDIMHHIKLLPTKCKY